MNSLRQEATSSITSIADDFLLEWKTPICSSKVLVLVEGKDDECFYYKFFKSDVTGIRSIQGCGRLTDLHLYLRDKGIKYICIKDSDFDRLNSKSYTSFEGFFCTDAHDYEMMCMKEPELQKDLMENLALEYSSSFFEQVLTELEYLSYFKWCNNKNHLNYNFKSFSVSCLTIDQLNNYDYIHGQILPKSSKVTTPLSKDALESFHSSNSSCDLYELVSGHDFINRFCFLLKSKYSKTENECTLKKTMHPCFRVGLFQRTKLYDSIKTWSNNNGLDILKN